MFSLLLKRNRDLLRSSGSYLLTQLDKIIFLLNDLENIAGHDYFDAFKQRKLSKGEYLLQEGSVSRYVWFLEKGIARMFDRKDDAEITSYFYFTGELIDAYCSSLHEVPSIVNIQVIEDSVVYALSRPQLRILADAYPVISEIVTLVLECHTIWLQKRIYDIQHLDALVHYKHICRSQPALIQYIGCNYLASYLGVTPETLSRIRAKVVCGDS